MSDPSTKVNILDGPCSGEPTVCVTLRFTAEKDSSTPIDSGWLCSIEYFVQNGEWVSDTIESEFAGFRKNGVTQNTIKTESTQLNKHGLATLLEQIGKKDELACSMYRKDGFCAVSDGSLLDIAMGPIIYHAVHNTHEEATNSLDRYWVERDEHQHRVRLVTSECIPSVVVVE
jgi:hypothetical protein